MKLDHQYHSWWKSKGRPPIPHGLGLRVYKAIQGHPESPRLWVILITRIITDLGFKPCKHEPCLYYNPDYKGNPAYFLRQVDDFAIGTVHESIAHEIIAKIDDHMTIKVKSLGIIDRFNGVDVEQSRYYTKIYNETYITKIIQDKVFTDDHSQFSPLPMSEDKDYNKLIESATPMDQKELQLCEKEFNFTYRQGIGVLIYAMVTCRPDISFPLIKLSQYSSAPSRVHFKAVQGIFNYLH